MITELSREELIELGARHRAAYLVEQAGYTLGVAAMDGKGLEDLLPEGYLKEVADTQAAVNAARQDKALAVEESGDSTKGQNAAVKAAKVWRRKVSKRALRARRMGKNMPDTLTTVSGARSVPAVAAQLTEMVKLLEANLPSLTGAGTDALLKEGKTLADALGSADAAQEVKRLKELPEKTQDFLMQKGILYQGLKVINDAGHELHASDSHASSRYNLAILHRHGGGKGPGDNPPQPPAS